MKIILHDSVKRPWGIETLITVDDSGTLYDFAVCTKTMPTKEELETEAVAWVDARKQREAEPTIEKEVASLEEQKATLEEDIALLEAQKASLEKDISDLGGR